VPRHPVQAIITVVVVAVLLLGADPRSGALAGSPARPSDQRLLADLGGRVDIARDRVSGRIQALSGGRRPLATAARLGHPDGPRDAAGTFLDRYGSLLGVSAPGRELRVARIERTPRAGTYVRYQQVVDGIPVLGGDIVVVVDERMGVRAVRGETTVDPSVEARPRIGATQAVRLAIAAVSRSTGVPRGRLSATQPGRWIYDPRLLGAPGLSYARLVWRMDVRGASGLVDQFVAVDAMTGSIALRFSQVRAAAARDAVQRICDQEGKREPALDRLPCLAGDAAAEPLKTVEVTRARQATEATFDFFWNRFGFDFPAGIPGDTAGLLVSTVRYCPSAAGGECPYLNAFWDGTQMVYGTGFAGADDVVGHELTHGVTEQGSNLYYYMQSGAINEALSDIFGELIDQTNAFSFGSDTTGDRWLVGEDIPRIGAIRDMEDPSRFGQPDRMGSDRYERDAEETDGGGVHTNSGVANRALVLMVEGGTLEGVTVPALDANRDVAIDQAAAIWFLAAQHLLTTASDYADLADALTIACDQLAGIAGGVLDGSGAVSAPIDATDDCGPNGTVARTIEATQMRLSPPRSPVARVPLCTDPDAPVDAILDDPIDASATGWQLDAGADQRWFVRSVYGFRDPAQAADENVPTYHLFGDDAPWTGAKRVVHDAVSIPGGGRPIFLWFRHAYGFDDGSQDLAPSENRYDGGVVEVRVGDDPTWRDLGPLFIDHGYDGVIYTGDQNPIKGRPAFTAESNGYGASRATLTGLPALDLAGKQVRLAFRVGTDSDYGDEGWFIDDVRIYRCGDTADDSPPEVSAPAVALRTGMLGSGGQAPVRVTFTAIDPSGVALTVLEHATGGGVPASILPSAVARRADATFPTGGTAQQVSAGAIDEQGNASSRLTRDLRMPLAQETDATFRGSWLRQASSAFSDGAVRYAAAAGRIASIAVPAARGIGFVSTRGPDRGKAKVCVSGASCKVIDLYSATTKRRQLVATWAFPGAASRVLTVTVLGQKQAASSGKRVDLDAVVAITD
jgi:bacillolysin